MTTFSEELEQKCGGIVEKMTRQPEEPTPAISIEREMALVMDHIERLRKHQEKERRQLTKRELEIGSQILNIENRVDLIPVWQERIRARDEAKRTLDQVKGQAFKLNWESEAALQKLQGRLLQLWNMHEQLIEENGYR